MYIAVISDTHDNIARVKKVLKYINNKKINHLIHCGDVCSQEVLEYINKNFKGNIYLSLGNAELFEVQNVKGKAKNKLKVFEEYKEVEIDGVKIGIVHKKSDIPLDKYQVSPVSAEPRSDGNIKYQKNNIKNPKIIFYGHTHKPWIEKVNQVYLANPGNGAGLFYPPTFAIYDTKNNKLELKLINKIILK